MFLSSGVSDVEAEMTTRKYVVRKGPEARLCLALVAAVLLPTGMLIYAWTARSYIHWIVPLLGLTVSFPSRPSLQDDSSVVSAFASTGLHDRRIYHLPGRLRLPCGLVRLPIIPS